MNKLPVLATIRAAYIFTFHHFGAIIGLIWLPKVVATVLSFFVQEHYFAALGQAMAAHDPAGAGPAVLGIMLAALITLLLYAMMIVPVVQLALGTREGGALVHVAFSAPEWRLFLSILGLAALLLLPLSLVLILANFALRGPAPQLVTLAISAAIFALEAIAVFFAVRFGALLAPAAASGESNVLVRSWMLSAGNFWRLLGVFIAVLGPLVLILMLLEVLVLGPAAVLPQFQTTPETAAAQMRLMHEKMPLLMGLDFLLSPFFLGLTLGAAAAAWQSLSRGAVETRNS
jgi:hypothetical protein